MLGWLVNYGHYGHLLHTRLNRPRLSFKVKSSQLLTSMPELVFNPPLRLLSMDYFSINGSKTCNTFLPFRVQFEFGYKYFGLANFFLPCQGRVWVDRIFGQSINRSAQDSTVCVVCLYIYMRKAAAEGIKLNLFMYAKCHHK